MSTWGDLVGMRVQHYRDDTGSAPCVGGRPPVGGPVPVSGRAIAVALCRSVREHWGCTAEQCSSRTQAAFGFLCNARIDGRRCPSSRPDRRQVRPRQWGGRAPPPLSSRSSSSATMVVAASRCRRQYGRSSGTRTRMACRTTSSARDGRASRGRTVRPEDQILSFADSFVARSCGTELHGKVVQLQHLSPPTPHWGASPRAEAEREQAPRLLNQLQLLPACAHEQEVDEPHRHLFNRNQSCAPEMLLVNLSVFALEEECHTVAACACARQ